MSPFLIMFDFVFIWSLQGSRRVERIYTTVVSKSSVKILSVAINIRCPLPLPVDGLVLKIQHHQYAVNYKVRHQFKYIRTDHTYEITCEISWYREVV